MGENKLGMSWLLVYSQSCWPSKITFQGMKKIYFILGGAAILILVLSIFIISILNSSAISENLFNWQKDKYCSFGNEVLSFETRCGFKVVTSFEDDYLSNQLWYVRQDDRNFMKDKELSSLDLSMYLIRGKVFPTSRGAALAYLQEITKFYKPVPVIEQLSIKGLLLYWHELMSYNKIAPIIKEISINGKKAWKLIDFVDSELPGGQHVSFALGGIIIEHEGDFIYGLNILSASDSLDKVSAYLRESDHIVNSIVWK